jgi:3-deoxy-D-manno-octulosonic acid (KDO) 8-phosphate synthase
MAASAKNGKLLNLKKTLFFNPDSAEVLIVSILV